MKNFAEFFSEEAIIRELARERLKRADRRGKRLFYRRIAPLPERLLDDRHEGDMLFPPRRLWGRFRPRDRRGKSAQALNLIALTRATSCLRGEMPHAAWAAQLSSTVTELRSRALGVASFEFAAPCIIPCEKDPGKNRFRPLAQFRLKDKIIEVLTARYLRHALDGALLASCLAFRVGEKGIQPPSIHSALNSIMAMNRRHRKRGLWVAECDIRAFFDCVGHDVAQRSLHGLIADRRRQTKDLHVDNRALEIFTAYLAAYSFSDNVLSAAPCLLRGRPKGAEFPWPAEDLRKLGYGNDLSRIGVPQGGAISCLIANAVLHAADKRLNRLDQPHRHFRYMRYCDDMIVLA
ncbi:MAG: reverse transcriptase domain-containing protein, partial [Bryobacteraceae bacterium]